MWKNKRLSSLTKHRSWKCCVDPLVLMMIDHSSRICKICRCGPGWRKEISWTWRVVSPRGALEKNPSLIWYPHLIASSSFRYTQHVEFTVECKSTHKEYKIGGLGALCNNETTTKWNQKLVVHYHQLHLLLPT